MTRQLHAPWLVTPSTQAVFAALEGGGFSARAVGGIVRNTLLGLPATDIDIATTAPPDETVRLAAGAGLKTIPTGLAHGTVTVIAHGVPYEVTTLRRDVATDGRHAEVAFTRDWAEDARRRDFTINALYCDRDGQLFDPLGGAADLAPVKIRFIGIAHERIREDYLRILRFFRFTATYSRDGALDPHGLAACSHLSAQLAQISGERIQGELFKLLGAPHAVGVSRALVDSGVFGALFPAGPMDLEICADWAALAKLVVIEAHLGLPPDPVLRLAALAVTDERSVARLDQRLKLSARDRQRLMAASRACAGLSLEMNEQQAQAAAYRLGPAAYFDAVALAWSRSMLPAGDAACRQIATLSQRWQAPVFPLTGGDALSLGIAPGPKLGALLARIEAEWIAGGFNPSKDALIERLERMHSEPADQPKS